VIVSFHSNYFIRFLLVAISVFSTSFFAISQDGKGAWHPVYENYTTKDGLLSMESYHTCQDKKGYIWFASDRGVVRYNGIEFKTFTKKDGLISDVVFKVVCDDKGRVWFLSNNAELCYYEEGKIKLYKYNHVLKKHFDNKPIMCYVAWSFKCNKVMYCASEIGGIEIDTKGNLKEFNTKAPKDVTTQIYERNGFFVNSMYNYLTPDLKGFKKIIIEIPGGEIKYSMDFHSRTLKTGWFRKGEPYVSDDYCVRIFRKKEIIEKYFENRVISVFVNGDCIWISFLNNGAKRFKVVNGEFVEELHVFSKYSITDIFRSDDGYLWFTSLSNGVFKMPDSGASIFQGFDEFNNQLLEIESLDDEVFVHTEKGDLFTLNKGDNSVQFLLDGIFVNGIRGQANSREGLYVNIGIEGGRKLVNNSHFKHNVLCSEKFKNTMALGGFSGVYLISNNGETEFCDYKKLRMIRSLTWENSSEIWVCANNHLEKLNIKTGKYSIPKEKILQQRINDVLKIGNRVYFATNGNGLIIKEGSKIWKISSEDGLPRDYIRKIRDGRDGTIWLMGLNGVTQLKLLANEKFEFLNYQASFLMCEKISSLSIGEKYAYIGANRGLIRIRKDNLLRKPNIPRVHITELVVNKLSQSLKKELSFSYDENNMVITFDAVSFEDLPIKFRYRFSKKEDWTVISEKVLRLNSLPGGNYHIEIQVSVLGSGWSESENVTFEICPPFWKTWWFILFEVVFGLALVLSLVYVRLRFVKQKYSIEQKNMQLRQEALSQQMNPHFIFNALGSVQNSILKGDSIKANSYLVKFSRLLRSGLNASRSQLISLEEDQELMLNYFSVEKTRLGEGFTFEVDVEIESAPYSLLITPFLLQPFIENSIKHGMTEDMESGFVKVLYKEQNGAIHCSIEDDGVGRTGTKLKSNTNHVSHGLNIAFERIDLFNKSNGFVGERRTIDLVDENETPKGTRVEFTVPALKAK
jgi:hypothetical protein